MLLATSAGNFSMLLVDLVDHTPFDHQFKMSVLLLSIFIGAILYFLSLIKFERVFELTYTWMMVSSFIFLFDLGSIRFPTASVFLIYIFVSPIFFGRKGVTVVTVSSTLIIGVLAIAEGLKITSPLFGPISLDPVFTYLIFFVGFGFLSNFLFGMFENTLREKERLSLALEQSRNTSVMFDLNGQITYVNDQFYKQTGYQMAEVIGHTPREILRLNVTNQEYYAIWEGLRAGIPWDGEYTATAKDGRTFTEASTIIPLYDTNGRVFSYLATGENITPLKRSEAALKIANDELSDRLDQVMELQLELKALSLKDPLTGLYNRRYFDEIIEREFDRSKREGIPLSIMMIDLDNFKTINDSYGHGAGDLVLKAVAQTINDSIRHSDFCCRFGGEEFILVSPGLSQEFAANRADLFRQNIEDLSIDWNDQKIKISASFGIAVSPTHSDSPEQLLKMADAAMYQSKLAGRNRVTLWNSQIS